MIEDPSVIVLLCAFALLAGFVDSIAGGGGLIQIPALFILVPQALPATVFGTNKLAAVAGTGVALYRYARKITIDWRLILPVAAAAMAAAWGGAGMVRHLDPVIARPLILVLLIVIAIYTFLRKDLGEQHTPKLAGGTRLAAGLVTGAMLGFYDGFFGPGTGSFLTFAFIGIFGYSFLGASAAARVVNFATNVSPLIYFAAHGHVIYEAALPMAACQIAGSTLGVKMAFMKGNRFVRLLFLLVVCGVIARFAWDVAGGVNQPASPFP